MNTRPVDLLDTSVKPDPFDPRMGDVYYSPADNTRAVVCSTGRGLLTVSHRGTDVFPGAISHRGFRYWLVSLNMVPAGKVREEAAQ